MANCPRNGVIGFPNGPPFTDGHDAPVVIGGTVRDAGCGDDCEDPSGVFPGVEDDQADLPGVSGLAE